ncbi:MAG: dipeptide ABC transporter ATP-binding protein [Pseudomonadota bacterium]
MTLLSVENLSLSIGDARILKDVSFDLEAGETLGLVGESGSGKSMTALSLMRLAPESAAVEGAVRFDGEDVLTMRAPGVRALRGRRIAMAFQEPMTALNPVETIGAQVAELFRTHQNVGKGEALNFARGALERAELPAGRFPLDRYPHELSGGQRQRVVIAMATALRPDVLIADEPTTALDVTTQAEILKLLRRLSAEDGTALLFITHDLAVIAEMADRVAVMKDGEIVEAGPTASLFAAASHPYTKALKAASTLAPRAPRPTEATAAPVLEAKSVVRDYVGPRPHLFAKPVSIRANDNVSLVLRPGETLGLVGESGCGKSTLARALMGLEAVQGGEVCLGGEVFSNRKPADVRALRRRIQVVFQDPYGAFNPRHAVGRIVAEPLHLLDAPPDKAETEKKVAAALESVGLAPGDAAKFPHAFSGGQRQRIAIARALIVRPDVVVLDEAVSALDVRVRAHILDLLADLGARLGIAYLFISHDLKVVRAVADRIAVMKDGRIVEEGATETVFAAPAHPYTASLLAATPDLGAALARRAERSAHAD